MISSLPSVATGQTRPTFQKYCFKTIAHFGSFDNTRMIDAMKGSFDAIRSIQSWD